MRYFGTRNEDPVTEAADLEDLDMIKDYVERTEARIKYEKNLPEPEAQKRKGKK